MRNECFVYINIIIKIRDAQAVDRDLGQVLNQGKQIKLQYNIFTNIMTRMLSNAKNIYRL